MLFVAFTLGVAGLVVVASPAQAATFTVTNTNDSGAGSLRQALADAEAAGAGDHVIDVTVTGTVVLASSLSYNNAGNITIKGNGLVLNASASGAAIDFFGNTEQAVLEDLAVEGGSSFAIGYSASAGIELHRVTVRDAQLTAAGGAGVFTQGPALIVDSVLSGNDVLTDGMSYPNGGAIFALEGVTVRNSTFVDNTAARDGGAIYAPWVNIENSTFVGNVAGQDNPSDHGWGGAIRLSAPGKPSVFRYSTFVGNETPPWNATLGGAGASIYGGGDGADLTFEGNVMAGPVGTPNCAGVSTESGNMPASLVTNNNYAWQDGNMGVANGVNFCGFDDPTDTMSGAPADDPGLMSLADNGGLTPTALPAFDSPLIDAIAPGGLCAGTDQRGAAYTRPWTSSPNCDIGAVEVRLPLNDDLAASSPDGQAVDIDLAPSMTDPDGYLDPSTLTITAEPARGNVVVKNGVVVNYAPDMPVPEGGYVDTFQYEICTSGSNYCVSATVTVTVAGAPPSDTAKYVPLPPRRIFDTRNGEPAGKLAGGATLDVAIRGAAGIPDDPSVTAVVLNVTATESTKEGYISVFPSGVDRPLASNLNLIRADQTAPNLVTVPIGDDGKVSFFSQNGTHLLADVAGYFVESPTATDGRFMALSPKRLFDTRTASAPSGFVATGESITIDVDGKAGLPADGVSAVALNLTADQASMAGYITAFPADVKRPLASNVNLDGPGHTTSNMAIVPVSPNGEITFYSHAGAHLIADVFGYFTDDTASDSTAGLFTPLTPGRVFDTRTPSDPSGVVGGGESITVSTAGVAGVPDAGASAVFLNVTATEALAPGYVTVSPAGAPRPDSSNLNLTQVGETRPNAAMLRLGTDGELDYFTQNGTHLLADVFGYFS